MIEPGKMRWWLTEEHTYYAVTGFRPVEVDHSNWVIGRQLGGLEAAGVKLVVCTAGIGMVGYYSRQVVIDRLGLTDAHVARLQPGRRGRPGHEKLAPNEYLVERGCMLIRAAAFHPEPMRELARVRFAEGSGRKEWEWAYYDRGLADRVRAVDPEIDFVVMPTYIDDLRRKYKRPKKLGARTRARLRPEIEWLETYYFEHNDDRVRAHAMKALEERIDAAEAAEAKEAADQESRSGL